MQVYKLTSDERATIEALNEIRRDVLMVVCDHPEIGCVVELDDLDNAKFDMYRRLLPVSLELEKIVEFTPSTE